MQNTIAELKSQLSDRQLKLNYTPVSKEERIAQQNWEAHGQSREYIAILQARNAQLSKRHEEATVKPWNASLNRKLDFRSVAHRMSREYEIKPSRLPGMMALSHLMWTGRVPSAADILSVTTCRNYGADFDLLEKQRSSELLSMAPYVATATDDTFNNGREYHVSLGAIYRRPVDQILNLLAGVRAVAQKDSESLANCDLEILLDNRIIPTRLLSNATDNASAAVKETDELEQAIVVTSEDPSYSIWKSWCDIHALQLSLVHAIYEAFGLQGDMNHVHVMNLAMKIGYVFGRKWPKYRQFLRFFNNGVFVSRPMRCVLTRWYFVTLNMIWQVDNRVPLLKMFHEIKLHLSTKDCHQHIFAEIRLWSMNLHLRFATLLIGEYGTVYLHPEMSWLAAQSLDPFPVPAGHRAHEMVSRVISRFHKFDQLLLLSLSRHTLS